MSNLILSIIGGVLLLIPTALFLYIMIQLLFRVLHNDIIFTKEYVQLLIVYAIIFSMSLVGLFIVYICN